MRAGIEAALGAFEFYDVGMKKLTHVQRQPSHHWVGDGFPVRSIFTYNDLAAKVSPFLLMDYAGPAEFNPNLGPRRGVGEHPHRGFETVTIVYQGEVEHRDSSGGGGIIQAGDVQWMTAASGVVHEELHGPNFSKIGGPFEMVQLWVNLPAKHKMASPRYQGIPSSRIPVVELPDGGGLVRVIAGPWASAKGPALTFTPIQLLDMRLKAGASLRLAVPDGHTCTLFVLSGKVKTVEGETLTQADLGVFESSGDSLALEVLQDSKVLFLGGEPIAEPIVGYGPFVMNTRAEIQQAFLDYQSGLMGRLKVTG